MDPLDTGHVGRRVVVRRVVGTADGRPRYADTLGELVAADATHLVVRPDRGGPDARIARADITAAKPVPPRRHRAGTGELQRIGARTWPAVETAPLGDWLLRASDGWTRRANSVLAVGDPGTPLAAAVDTVTAWYAARGLPPLAQLADGEADDLDALLADRGWPAEASTLLLTAPISRVCAAATAGALPPVTFAAEPSADWLALFGARKGVSAAARTVLTGGDTTFAEVRGDGGELAAIGRGATADGHLLVAAVEVVPAYRRRGLARHLMAALADRHTDRAHTVFLQVEDDNTAARTLYDRLGFRLHHAYHYRVAP
ncbi:MAG TPA: GNAT family N-acetyltransferase [Actinocatenispora sp.]